MSAAPADRATVQAGGPGIRNVAVFCGSSDLGTAAHKAEAAVLGRGLAQAGLGLVYGGGRVGLMGRVADAALAAGGTVIGVIPKALEARELANRHCTRLEITASMHARKARMFELAEAFVVLPGGLGTLDETIEVLTWRQLGAHDKPVLLLDIDGFWAPFTGLVAHLVASGYVPRATAETLSVVPSAAAALALLATLPAPTRTTDPRDL